MVSPAVPTAFLDQHNQDDHPRDMHQSPSRVDSKFCQVDSSITGVKGEGWFRKEMFGNSKDFREMLGNQLKAFELAGKGCIL